MPVDHDGQHDLYDLRLAQRQNGMPCQPVGQYDLHVVSLTVNTEPLTKSQIFSVLWMLLIALYLFTGPRNFTVSTEISFLLVGLTVFALWTLGKRFPMFGLFLLMMISSLMRGGRRRRW